MLLQQTKRASVHSTDMGDADDENSGQNCVSVASKVASKSGKRSGSLHVTSRILVIWSRIVWLSQGERNGKKRQVDAKRK